MYIGFSAISPGPVVPSLDQAAKVRVGGPGRGSGRALPSAEFKFAVQGAPGLFQAIFDAWIKPATLDHPYISPGGGSVCVAGGGLHDMEKKKKKKSGVRLSHLAP